MHARHGVSADVQNECAIQFPIPLSVKQIKRAPTTHCTIPKPTLITYLTHLTSTPPVSHSPQSQPSNTASPADKPLHTLYPSATAVPIPLHKVCTHLQHTQADRQDSDHPYHRTRNMYPQTCSRRRRSMGSARCSRSQDGPARRCR